MTDDGNILKSDRKWQSDIIVDLIKQYGFKHIALNPGASYRGLHDSLVNYGENDPAMMICNHEKIAVQMAHGYAKATGEPMIAIVIMSSGCYMPSWPFTMPISTARRYLSSAQPDRPTKASAGRLSTGSTPPPSRAMRCAISQSGIISPAASTAFRIPSPAPIRS
jgi:hypothetical protein